MASPKCPCRAELALRHIPIPPRHGDLHEHAGQAGHHLRQRRLSQPVQPAVQPPSRQRRGRQLVHDHARPCRELRQPVRPPAVVPARWRHRRPAKLLLLQQGGALGTHRPRPAAGPAGLREGKGQAHRRGGRPLAVGRAQPAVWRDRCRHRQLHRVPQLPRARQRARLPARPVPAPGRPQHGNAALPPGAVQRPDHHAQRPCALAVPAAAAGARGRAVRGLRHPGARRAGRAAAAPGHALHRGLLIARPVQLQGLRDLHAPGRSTGARGRWPADALHRPGRPHGRDLRLRTAMGGAPLPGQGGQFPRPSSADPPGRPGGGVPGQAAV